MGSLGKSVDSEDGEVRPRKAAGTLGETSGGKLVEFWEVPERFEEESGFGGD